MAIRIAVSSERESQIAHPDILWPYCATTDNGITYHIWMHSKAELFQSFFLGAASSAALMLVCKQLHMVKLKNQSSKTESLENVGPALGFTQRILPDELREEQLSRNILFFGEDGMKSICQSSVVVVGLGGVGSHAANMLARAGVGYLRLIDFDQVTLSSLNRHACATLSDVGKPKVEVMKNYITNICAGHCHVDGRIAMFKEEIQDELLGSPNNPSKRHDFIVDAIDDVTTKVQLLAYCVRTGTRVISCMGAGGKCDVTRLQIGDLPSACHDPLATKIRLFLKRRQIDVTSDLINVVYSSEKTVAPLAELSEEQKKHGNEKFGAIDHMRVRVIPVLGTTPAIMGNSCAALALCAIGKIPFMVRIAFNMAYL
jgi:tRNA A37 threonylcarbamoyladenosine dehydratase